MDALRKLRIEFVLVMMGIVILFLVAIFSVQIISSRREMKTNSDNALEMALEEKTKPDFKPDGFELENIDNDDVYEGDDQDGDDDDHDSDDIGTVDNNDGDMESTELPNGSIGGPAFGGRMMDRFYDNTTRTAVLVARVDYTGGISTVRNDMFYMEEDYIEELVSSTPYNVDIDEWTSCELQDYHMRYMIDREGSDTYIAYVDESESNNTLSSLIRKSILISVVVTIVMLILSLFLSRLVLRPVEKAWEDQKRFVADASHELKTPLAVILSNTEMMVKSQDRNTDKNQRRLDNIRIESERMKELVQELLEIARGDISNKHLVREDVNLSDLIEGEILVWDPTYYEAGQTLEQSIDQDIHITGDSTKLRRLINILIDNALKYSDEHSTVRVSLSREGTGGRKRNGILLKVENKGQPLTREECTRIFERFYRADKSRESISGYGLGLSIAVGIAREHNAEIYAESDGVDTNYFCVLFKS